MRLGRLYLRVLHALSWGQGPNPRARDELDTLLTAREDLSKEVWFDSLCTGREARADVLNFLFEFFGSQNISFGKLRPDDRLVEDVRMWKATWNDWEFDLAERFEDSFKNNPFMHPDFEKMRTVMDLLVLLSQTATAGTVTRRRLTSWFWVRRTGG